MKKIIFGNPQIKLKINPTNLLDQVVAIEAKTVEPVKETVIVETHTVEVQKVTTKDKLARLHTRLSRKKIEKAMDEMCETLETQNTVIADLRSQVKKLAEISETHGFAINAVRMEKPKEIPVLTERTVVEKHIPKKLVYALIGSMLLNVVIMLVK